MSGLNTTNDEPKKIMHDEIMDELVKGIDGIYRSSFITGFCVGIGTSILIVAVIAFIVEAVR